MSTPNMNITLPVPSSTQGPEWAEQINTGFEVVDAHDHSTGKGVKITPAGININANLSFNGNSATDVNAITVSNQTATLSGPSNLNTVYVVNGNLYYTNAAGVPIQITNGSSVASSTDGVSRSFEILNISGATTINPSTTASYISVNSSFGTVAITLPNAASVANGRFYYIKDATGNANANNITIVPNGAQTIDGTTDTFSIQIAYGSCLIVSDGVSNWQLYRIQVNTADLTDASITTAKIANGAVTTAKLATNVNSTSSSSGSFSTTSNTEVAVTNLSVTITRTGRPVVVQMIEGQVGVSSTNMSSNTATINIKRNSTVISASSISTTASSSVTTPSSGYSVLDTSAGTGSTTYSVYALVSATGAVTITNAKLIAYEI